MLFPELSFLVNENSRCTGIGINFFPVVIHIYSDLDDKTMRKQNRACLLTNHVAELAVGQMDPDKKKDRIRVVS